VRWLIGAAVVLALAGCGGSKVPPVPMHCTGSGMPTFVLEGGLGQTQETWDRIRSGFAQLGRVCTYDRPDLGSTPKLPPDAKRTVSDQASTLQDSLEAASIEPPYILVGHSWGGAIVQAYASKHSDDVAGVVLVDSSHPDTIPDTLAVLPPAPTDLDDPYAGTRQLLRGLDDPSVISEHVDLEGSRKTLHNADLHDIPLVVLTAGANEIASALPTALRHNANNICRDDQNELAGLSDDSVHAIARLSGHFIQNDQPDLVLAAIRGVERAARAHAKLAPCRAIFRGLAARCVPATS
jgi:pimeloyl-ACP methyl ester carboxylesterase